MHIFRFIFVFIDKFHRVYRNYIKNLYYTSRLGYCGHNVKIRTPNAYTKLKNMYLYNNTELFEGFNFLSKTGKFIMKNNSGAAQGLTIITGNHSREKGLTFMQSSKQLTLDVEKDVIVDEDVWIGANVTLLAGITIGRGATIGAGAVCHRSIPPYAIVMGNPAKIIGFNYTPDEIVEHEKNIYPEEERLSFDQLNKNYNKYYIEKNKSIREFLKL